MHREVNRVRNLNRMSPHISLRVGDVALPLLARS